MIAAIRVGLGYDIHRLRPDTCGSAHVMVGGVAIPCPFRVIAHSDGDVVLHALGDAILGATAQGDLGEWFPDTDPSHKGRSSDYFIERILASPGMVERQLINVDINIIAQAPRLGAHKTAIRQRLAQLLKLAPDRIGIKARTKEECDAVGQQAAIEAQAAILIGPQSDD